MSRLRVDWPACRGHGVCAELLPELVDLDEWGYPLVDGDARIDDDRALLLAARTAVKACPALALHLDPGGPRRP